MVFQANVRWTTDMQFLGVSGSGHSVVLDTAPANGGTDTGPTPMEFVLIALAGCTGMDVVSLLRKMRVPFTGFEIKVRGERREEHPRIFTRIDIEYVIYADPASEPAVRRAIELSQERYCSVAALLRPACPINHTYKIVTGRA